MDQRTCPVCGTAVDDGQTQGLCPACLLRGGLTAAAPAEKEHPLGAALRGAIGGQYEIQRLLGKGAMGAVFLAREKALDREVAIKVLPPDGSGDGEERFRREARIAARLTHPNIVPLHSFGEASGLLYFVMGYVRGESLGSRMRRGLSVASAQRILVELADALDHAHRQGVVHRDVKPDNVIVDDDSGRAMLADFGIARRDTHSALTSTGAVVGTPQYMSPEQASGATTVDGRSDIYSLGILAYAMLAGRLPFDGPMSDVLVQHMTREAAPLRSVAPAVPEALAAVVTRCLAKDPRDRWPDARALKEALIASDATDDVPEPLREVEGNGLLFLLAIAVATALEVGQWLWLRPVSQVLGVVSVIGVLTLIRRGLPVRRAGFSWSRIAWAAFLEPSWWPFWYPRPLRRPEEDDVWGRLPARLRLQRWIRLLTPITALAGVLVFAAFFSPRFHNFSDWPALQAFLYWPTPRPSWAPPLSGPVIMLGWLVVHFAGFLFAQVNERWLAGFGLPEHDRRAMVHGPLARRAFWKRNAIAAVLRPLAASEPTPARTPAEMAQRIAAAAAVFTGRDADVAREAAAAARHLLASIQEADAEIERLSGDLDPHEQERVRARLSALGVSAPTEAEDRRQMRALLEQQSGLLGSLAVRLARASDRRQGRVELLKSLWLEVANLKAAATVALDGQTSARVQELCTRIQAVHAGPTAALDEDTPTVAR